MAVNVLCKNCLQAPHEGYEDAIVVLKLKLANFEISWVTKSCPEQQFFGIDKGTHMLLIHVYREAWDSIPKDSSPSLSTSMDSGAFHQLDTFYYALNVNDQGTL
ncbi:hypothetical protein Tco_0168593 [Tanacetum coccineum]